MKGIILAGGTGSRLYPLTLVASKQLQPVYDKPMVYYPLTTLIASSIREFCLISTPHDLPRFRQLLGDGSAWGISIEYREQPKPEGIAQAFLLAESFLGKDDVTLILGDNIFFGGDSFPRAFSGFESGATIFAYHVQNPERYGVVEFDAQGQAVSIEEKPKKPRSNYAVPGVYIFDNQAVEIAKALRPSARGELEIVDMTTEYLRRGQLRVVRLSRGFAWLDAGTSSSLHDASAYVQTIEKRQGMKIGCPEEAAFRRGFLKLEQLAALADKMPQCEYRDYLKGLVAEGQGRGMIVLLGASGYVGQSFAHELARHGWDFTPLSRKQIDYARFDVLLKFLRERKPEFVINAAGFTGVPNIDACEAARAETLQGNTLLPVTIAQACAATGIPWGHVSSGGIYSGAWVVENGRRRVAKSLKTLAPLTSHFSPPIAGFTETDEPNFTFRQPPCSFYCGSKALAEEAISGVGESYLWRMQMPFDQFDAPKNHLTKLLRYPKLCDSVDSLSHRGDFARACLDLWARRAPFGTYNLTNPGFVTTRQVVSLMQKILKPGRDFHFFADDEEFYRGAARTPRSNCVLDVSKLLSTGIELRPVEEALVDALKNWQPAKK